MIHTGEECGCGGAYIAADRPVLVLAGAGEEELCEPHIVRGID